MKRLLLALAMVGSLLLLVSPPAHGGGIPPFTVTGDFGPGGTITVSGSQCLSTNQQGEPEAAEATASVVRFDPFETVGFATTFGDLNGDWSVQITISGAAVPGEEYTIRADCELFSLGDGPLFFDYPDVVQVMGQPVTPTTDTTAPTTETTAGGGGEATEAGETAGTSAATSPRFTG